MLGISVKSNQIWSITPFVLTLFSLALNGSINAARPVFQRLKRVQEQLGCEFLGDCDFAFYDIDTSKNIVDYLSFLSIYPERAIGTGNKGRYNPKHFLYPLVFLWASVTTLYATLQVEFPSQSLTYVFKVAGFLFLGLQLVFSSRRYWFAICRFWGIRKDETA